MIQLTDPKDILAELRKKILELGLKPVDVVEMMEDAGNHISLTHVRRICDGKHDDMNFSVKNIIMPLSHLLLDIDTHSDDESTDVALMKELLLAKRAMISKLENQNADLKKQNAELVDKYKTKIEKINAEHEKDNKDWMHQVELKDNRIDRLFESNERKDQKIDEKEAKIVELETKINKLLSDLQDLLEKCGNCNAHVRG